MAKIEDSTKRPNEVDEQSVTPRPPKKRFLSRASSPDEGDSDEEETSDSFKPLEAFRKDAIMRQWKEYTRSIQRWKKYVEQAESNKLKSEEHLRLWEEAFKKLQVFLSNIIQEGMSSFGGTPSSMDVDSNTFDSLLNEEWATDFAPNVTNAYKRKDYKDLSIAKLNQLLESWINKRENMTHGFESVFEQGSLKEIQKDHERILEAWVKGQRSLQDMKHRYQSTNFKFLLFSEELRLLNEQLHSTESNLRQAQMELDKAKHQNAVKDEDTKVVESTFKSPSPMPPPQSSIMPSMSTTIQGNTAMYNNQDPLIHAQQLLEQRLRDIEIIKEDRISIKQQIARLEMDLVCVPESRIYKATMCRQLSQSRAYHKDKCNRLSDICHDLQSGLDDLTANRRRLMKELDSEQVTHFKDLEEQLRKLDEDLTRIRGQRDSLQMNLEERKAATEVGRASIIELKVIADTRKERVNYLETEVLRLQKKMAARTGVKDYFDLLMQSDGREPLLLPLQNELKSLEEQVEQTKMRVYQDIPKETVDHELAQISELKQLELEVAAFEHKYGFHPSKELDDTQVEKILQDRIEQKKKVILESKEKIMALEATEKQLLSEIESVARAYGDLEEENMKRVNELAAAEDEIIKLQSERVKYSQTFTALNKSKDAHTMVANSLTKQIEKQLNQIKCMNEREKNLSSQLTSLDRELNTSNSVYEIYKQKSEEAKLVLDELKEKTAFSKDKILELQKSILDKIRAIEEGTHIRLRLEESNELLKRKVDSTNKVDRPAEMKLRKEREEYRSLLNCSSCRVRLKSHIILKCMHTFCKDCLDSTKRCPSCDESFSTHDVKQFYF